MSVSKPESGNFGRQKNYRGRQNAKGRPLNYDWKCFNWYEKVDKPSEPEQTQTTQFYIETGKTKCA